VAYQRPSIVSPEMTLNFYQDYRQLPLITLISSVKHLFQTYPFSSVRPYFFLSVVIITVSNVQFLHFQLADC